MSDTVKLKRKVLITVGREYGSAGHIVARRLGERLSIPVFDKNLLTIIARKHGLDEITLLSSDERVGNLFFELLVLFRELLYVIKTGKLPGQPDADVIDPVLKGRHDISRHIADRSRHKAAGQRKQDQSDADN